MKIRDYCTMSPDRFGKKDWSMACKQHDIVYSELYAIRLEGDRAFRKRMNKSSWIFVSTIYYYTVRIFGRIRI